MKCSFGLEKTNLLLSLKSSCSLLVGQIFILSCIRYVLKPFQFYCFLAELLVFENNSAVLLSPNGCLKVELCYSAVLVIEQSFHSMVLEVQKHRHISWTDSCFNG